MTVKSNMTNRGLSQMSKEPIIVCSYHHGNTEKVARAMTDALNAEVKRPDEDDLRSAEVFAKTLEMKL